MADIPLWLSQDQADRLKSALEVEGFDGVAIRRGIFGGELVVTAHDGGTDFNVSVTDPMGLEIVVGRFLKWREQRRAD